MNKLVIGTHSGIFHSDEIIASALLVSFMGKASFIRSRDPKVLSSADILVDVGGEYNCINKFDHHQLRDGDSLYGLSSAGMVARYIGSEEDYLYDDSVSTYIDDLLVSAVDARDTRVNWDKDGEFESLFNSVSNCNNIDVGSKAQDEMFEVLVSIFVEYFNNSISYDELLRKVSVLGVENKTEYDIKMTERFKNVSRIGMVRSVPMYATQKYEYVNTHQHFGNTPFIFVHLDTLDKCYGVTTNTNFYKIVSISNPINGMVEGVHANGFFAKTTTLDGLEIKIEEVL